MAGPVAIAAFSDGVPPDAERTLLNLRPFGTFAPDSAPGQWGSFMAKMFAHHPTLETLLEELLATRQSQPCAHGLALPEALLQGGFDSYEEFDG